MSVTADFQAWDGFEWREGMADTDRVLTVELCGRVGFMAVDDFGRLGVRAHAKSDRLNADHPATIGVLEEWALSLGCCLDRGRGADWMVCGQWEGRTGDADGYSSPRPSLWRHRVESDDAPSPISYAAALMLAIMEATQ